MLDATTLAWGDYDGNGQFRSLGNLLVNPHVGLLFVDFAQPRRLRVNGRELKPSDRALKETCEYVFWDRPKTKKETIVALKDPTTGAEENLDVWGWIGTLPEPPGDGREIERWLTARTVAATVALDLAEAPAKGQARAVRDVRDELTTARSRARGLALAYGARVCGETG